MIFLWGKDFIRAKIRCRSAVGCIARRKRAREYVVGLYNLHCQNKLTQTTQLPSF